MEIQIKTKNSKFYSFFKNIYNNEEFKKELKLEKEQAKLKMAEDVKKEEFKKKLRKDLVKETDILVHILDDKAITGFINRGYNLTVEQATYWVINNKSPVLKNATLTLVQSNILKIYQQEIAPTIATSMNKIYSVICESFSSRDTQAEKIVNHYKKFEDFSKFFADDQAILFQNPNFVIGFLPVAKKILKEIESEVNFVVSPYSAFTENRETTLKFKIFNDHLTNVVEQLEKNHTELVEDFLNKNIDKYSVILDETDNIKDNMISDVIKNIKNFKETDLPVNIKEIIDDLRSLYREITQSKLNTEQKLELNNLYNKRFPQVLEEYITVSPRYKEKLKSHQENPDALLFESLSEIKNKINDIFESLQENNLTKMKVTNKYLKNI